MMKSRNVYRVKYFACLIIGLLVIPAFAAAEGTDVEIRYFARGKKVIPFTYDLGSWRVTDIKLPDLVVTNRQKRKIEIESIDVIGRAAGSEAVRYKIRAGEMAELISQKAKAINANPPLFFVRTEHGDVVMPDGPVSEGPVVVPGASVMLPLASVLYVHHVGHQRIDGLQLDISVRSGGKKKLHSVPVALTFYEVKGKYIFPLKGDVHLGNLAANILHHRNASSQEFAFDAVGAAVGGAESFTDSSTPNPRKLSDFAIWGRDVLAIGEGTVVDVADRFPEERMSDLAKVITPGYTMSLIMELVDKIGPGNSLAGNYITIDHGNGEFSMYCHLKEGTIRVKAGQKVAKGEVIAQVGNTGNSSEPHLHFQLMDSRDFFRANGLPVMFENIPSEDVIATYRIKTNVLGFSDNLYSTVR
ncbi:MAG TPA: M23 family metallopeptidase [Syntrophales bacterium]|nr:M23 family metallopeptidase [Syntrophales bacterium]